MSSSPASRSSIPSGGVVPDELLYRPMPRPRRARPPRGDDGRVLAAAFSPGQQLRALLAWTSRRLGAAPQDRRSGRPASVSSRVALALASNAANPGVRVGGGWKLTASRNKGTPKFAFAPAGRQAACAAAIGVAATKD